MIKKNMLFKKSFEIKDCYKQILILLVVCSSLIGCSNSSNTIKDFSQSIKFVNSATLISNKGKQYQEIGSNSFNEWIDLHKKALSYSEKVNIEALNKRFDGFGKHYDEEFQKGLLLIINGYETTDNIKLIEGQKLLDKWGDWYSENIDNIRNRK